MKMLMQTHRKTPGTGMADDVPAAINGSQPAALSEGEYVIPADVVGMIGDGNTDAGSKILDKMVAQIRTMKQGHSKQASSMSDLIKKTVRKAKNG